MLFCRVHIHVNRRTRRHQLPCLLTVRFTSQLGDPPSRGDSLCSNQHPVPHFNRPNKLDVQTDSRRIVFARKKTGQCSNRNIECRAYDPAVKMSCPICLPWLNGKAKVMVLLAKQQPASSACIMPLIKSFCCMLFSCSVLAT